MREQASNATAATERGRVKQLLCLPPSYWTTPAMQANQRADRTREQALQDGFTAIVEDTKPVWYVLPEPHELDFLCFCSACCREWARKARSEA